MITKRGIKQNQNTWEMSRALVSSFLAVLLILMLSSPSFGQTYSFVHNSIVRSYIVHLPTNYNPANQYPLVINMHGLSNTAAIQETYTGMNAVSDTGNFVIIYPDAFGTTSFNAGFNSPYNSGVDDVGFINALLDTAIANYSIDTLRIYACGMSNGGFMSYRLACELEHRIAAIASVTGSMPDSMEYYCQNSRAVPVMQVHGTTDPTVNYNGAPGIWAIEATVDYWVQKNNCPNVPIQTQLPNISLLDLSTVEKFYYGLCDDATEVVLYKITNGGHTWPGAIPVPVLGNTNQDFNASGEIWNFFRKHTLPSSPNPTPLPNLERSPRFNIWPNPGFDIIRIDGMDLKEVEIRIFTLLGQEVGEMELRRNTSEPLILDISKFKRGIYMIKITTEDGVYSELLSKQ